MADNAAIPMFYIKNTGDKGKGQLAVGMQNAHDMCATLTNNTLPPVDVFGAGIGQAWFEQAFGIKVTKAQIDNVTEELSRVQNEYETHNKLAKQLKSQRTALIQASLLAGASTEAIQDKSGQTVFTIQDIAAKLDDVPEGTQSQLEEAVEAQKIEATKRRLKIKGAKPKNEHEQKWLHKWGELKAADEARRESKKRNDGDEWWGADITAEQYEQLKREIDTMMF